MPLNRPLTGYLNNKKITIYTLDIIERIKTKAIENGYNFIFKISKQAYKEINRSEVYHLKINPDVNVLLYMKLCSGCEINGEIEATYEIVKFENIN